MLADLAVRDPKGFGEVAAAAAKAIEGTPAAPARTQAKPATTAKPAKTAKAAS